MTSSYNVRQFKSTDRSDYLELYAHVFGERPSLEWFQWKYEKNPYLNHVPIHVVEYKGRIVGARGNFALRMSIDAVSHAALQPCDVMVHADHRRKGLHKQLINRAIERYSNEDFSFFFSFPNHRSLSNKLKRGFTEVGRIPLSLRLNNLDGGMGQFSDNLILGTMGKVLDPIWSMHMNIHENFDDVGNEDNIRIEKSIEPPVRALLAIEEHNDRRGIQSVRGLDFYGWRYNNPNHDYNYYIAWKNDRPIAAVIVRPGQRNGRQVASIVDILPRNQRDRASVRQVLTSALSDNANADIVRTITRIDDLNPLLKYRFVRMDKFPLTVISKTRPLTVFPLSDLVSQKIYNWKEWNISLTEWDVE